MRYRRLALEVEARQFGGVLDDELEAWIGRDHVSWRPAQMGNPATLEIRGSLGEVYAVHPGDWIVKGQAGTYAVPDSLFQRTHEEAGANG